MKKLLLTSAIIYSAFLFVRAQSWTAQTSGTSAGLSSVYFSSVTNGWAVGTNGTIIATADGGTTWAPQTSGETNHLSDIHFVDGLTGFATGSAGLVIKTTNGGTTWTDVSPGAPMNLTGAWVDASNVWVCGEMGGFAVSGDWGANWSPHSTSALNMADCEFSGSHGWVVDQIGTISKTTDGGTNWIVQPSGVSSSLNSISFVSQTEGWISGNGGVILHTTDGGANWNPQTSGITTHIASIHFASNTHGWAVSGGDVLSTTNGGTTWTVQTGVSPVNLLSIHFPSTTVGYAVGGNGNIYKYSAGTASINNIDENIEVFVYPNPTSTTLTVQTDESIEQIFLYNSMGALVQSETKNTFSVENLAPGIYLLQLKTKNGMSTTRFIKTE